MTATARKWATARPMPGAESRNPDERFAAVAREHLDFVWRALRRQGLARADADDGVQRVFLLFREKAAGIEPGTEKGFLFRAAGFVAKELRRGARRCEEVTDSNGGAEPSPSGRIEVDDLLDKVMRDLDDDERQVFLLFENRRTDDGGDCAHSALPTGDRGLPSSTRPRQGSGGGHVHRADPRRCSVSAFVRLAKDPNAPAALREALDDAAGETASPDVLLRVLGAAGAGTGAALALTTATHAAGTWPRLLGGSAATKGIAAFAIFAAGAVAGGYAVHDHDVRQLALADAGAPLAFVDRASSSPSPIPSDGVPESPPPEPAVPAVGVVSAAPVTVPRAAPPVEHSPRPAERAARIATPRPTELPTTAAPLAVPAESPARSWGPSAREELVSLRGIRAAIDGDRPDDALGAIATHRAKYPRSVFDQELLLLEAQARWARLDPAACGPLNRFAIGYPRSLLLARVQALRAAARCDTSQTKPPHSN